MSNVIEVDFARDNISYALTDDNEVFGVKDTDHPISVTYNKMDKSDLALTVNSEQVILDKERMIDFLMSSLVFFGGLDEEGNKMDSTETL